MNKFETNKISKPELKKINENDLVFITNPGRMGDEDGSTFIVKHDNNFMIYRVDGWMYRKPGEKEEISLGDMSKQFPQWREAWKHGNDKDYNGKYKYLYMGFGNGLSVDKSICDDFEQYLNRRLDEYLKDENPEEKESLKYAAIFNVWEEAFIDMINDKKYSITKKDRR